jgi:hypothetical protein
MPGTISVADVDWKVGKNEKTPAELVGRAGARAAIVLIAMAW